MLLITVFTLICCAMMGLFVWGPRAEKHDPNAIIRQVDVNNACACHMPRLLIKANSAGGLGLAVGKDYDMKHAVRNKCLHFDPLCHPPVVVANMPVVGSGWGNEIFNMLSVLKWSVYSHRVAAVQSRMIQMAFDLNYSGMQSWAKIKHHYANSTAKTYSPLHGSSRVDPTKTLSTILVVKYSTGWPISFSNGVSERCCPLQGNCLADRNIDCETPQDRFLFKAFFPAVSHNLHTSCEKVARQIGLQLSIPFIAIHLRVVSKRAEANQATHLQKLNLSHPRIPLYSDFADCAARHAVELALQLRRRSESSVQVFFAVDDTEIGILVQERMQQFFEDETHTLANAPVIDLISTLNMQSRPELSHTGSLSDSEVINGPLVDWRILSLAKKLILPQDTGYSTFSNTAFMYSNMEFSDLRLCMSLGPRSIYSENW